jgi:hypothetical protein
MPAKDKNDKKEKRVERVSTAMNPPLPWAWLAFRAGWDFSTRAFELWWQVRALGQPHPKDCCPWCEGNKTLTRAHLERECFTFAERCWILGLRPEESFGYPVDEGWFRVVLRIMAEVDTSRQRNADDIMF